MKEGGRGFSARGGRASRSNVGAEKFEERLRAAGGGARVRGFVERGFRFVKGGLRGGRGVEGKEASGGRETIERAIGPPPSNPPAATVAPNSWRLIWANSD